MNGELAHSDETDDDYTGGGAHPGASIVPTTLALGERAGISGTHFLRAVTLGYDIGMRAFKTVGEAGVLKDTHNLVGTFGSCAAAGCALSLNAAADALAGRLCRATSGSRHRLPGGATPTTSKRASSSEPWARATP